MPSLFTNRWGISRVEEDGEGDLDHQDQVSHVEPDKKSSKKRKDRKRKHDEADQQEPAATHQRQQNQNHSNHHQQQQHNHGRHSQRDSNGNRSDMDVDAAVMNFVAGELTDDKKRKPYDSDMFGYNDQHQWQNYINEEPTTHDEYNVFAKQNQQQPHSQQGEGPLPKKARKKKKNTAVATKSQSNVDPALESIDRSREEANPHEQILIQEAVREATEIARSLQSDTSGKGTASATSGNNAPSSSDAVSQSSEPQKAQLDAAKHEAPDTTSAKTTKKSAAATSTTNNNRISATTGLPTLPVSATAGLDQSAKLKASTPPLTSTSASPASQQRRDVKRAAWTGDGTEMGGSFTDEEKKNLDEFMDNYMKSHQLDKEQLKSRVWASERRKDNFWDLVSQVLPNRTRASVYKHVRRAYHVFHVRGKWTDAEDKELDRLFKEKGAQWKQIGSEMGRMPEDCRDRWRNYVKCGTNRHQNKWSTLEENRLRQIVTEIIAEDPNGDVNWTAVSEKMDGQRSRIQCRYKWNKLCKKQSPSKIDAMLPGDHLVMADYLKNSDVSKEQEVNWEELASLEGKGLWTADDFKEAFGRLKKDIGGEKSFLEYVDEILKRIRDLPESRRSARFKHNGDVLEEPVIAKPIEKQGQELEGSKQAVEHANGSASVSTTGTTTTDGNEKKSITKAEPSLTSDSKSKPSKAGKSKDTEYSGKDGYIESWKLKN